jgi:hypothetical protein
VPRAYDILGPMKAGKGENKNEVMTKWENGKIQNKIQCF